MLRGKGSAPLWPSHRLAKGELITEARDHSQREGAVDALVLEAVAGVAAGQGAERHRSRHKAPVGASWAFRHRSSLSFAQIPGVGA